MTALVVASATVHAQPQPQPRAGAPALVEATEVARYTASSGFVDDAVAAEDQRIAYVIADSATKAELHVVSFGTEKVPEQVIEIASITLHPIALTLAGSRALIVGTSEDGVQSAAMIELTEKSKTKPAGTVVYRIAPAAHVAVIARDGKRVIAVDRTQTGKAGTRHEVEIVSLETGRRIAGGRALELDPSGANAALDFHVNHWSDGMTRAHGIKGGEWNKKDDQRSPDTEATYDLVTGKFVEQTKIADLFEQHKRYQVLADAGATSDFVRIGDKGLELWRAGKPQPLELDQPLASYEPKSLQGIVLADGSGWLALKIDPVNPDAVARKKADPEYLDIFRFAADGKAVRKARILATGARHRFGLARGDAKVGATFWLVERNHGFERGGKSIAVYALAP